MFISHEKCWSYGNLHFGVTFLEHAVYIRPVPCDFLLSLESPGISMLDQYQMIFLLSPEGFVVSYWHFISAYLFVDLLLKKVKA